jgi:Domain of unknown function (DUF4926)
MKLLDVVALTQDEPEKGLRRGQVGTIVETLASGSSKSSSATWTGGHMPRLPCLKVTSCFFTISRFRPWLDPISGFRDKSGIVAEVDE